ncbi:P27 family phage terminase small subunit [Carnobacterium maltaromaticum]|uniref:P27 family phage terminase small subunit n=1 Tax=Carnobacterium maltaromaticum TaxID=2751 RepID=UPI0039B10721
MATKKERQKIVAEKVIEEKKRILNVLKGANMYSLTLDPLIESYLDSYEIYMTMFLEWKGLGFPASLGQRNSQDIIVKKKHPLAQQVESWSDKKIKALEKLGLTNKIAGRKVIGNSKVNDELEKPIESQKDELAEHREKWRKKS